MTLTERRPVASNGKTIYGDDGRNRAKEETGRALRRVDGERKPMARRNFRVGALVNALNQPYGTHENPTISRTSTAQPAPDAVTGTRPHPRPITKAV